MEEKWKVYIRGNKDRGKEVIKALTDLGAKNPCKYIGSASNHLYHIGYDGNIYLTYLNSEYGHIIMDNYHELHLSEQWKRGDILFSETHKEFAVFESDCIFPDRAECYFVTDNRKCLTDKSICKKDFRLATGSEIALFYNFIERRIIMKEEWKDGDILINNGGACYKVFSEYNSDIISIFDAYNVSISVDGIINDNNGGWICEIKDYRLATPSEIKRFYELLHKHGKDWDAKNKKLITYRWKPKCGESYFYVTPLGEVKESILDKEGAEAVLGFGNYFFMEEEAKRMAEKIKKLLNTEL